MTVFVCYQPLRIADVQAVRGRAIIAKARWRAEEFASDQATDRREPDLGKRLAGRFGSGLSRITVCSDPQQPVELVRRHARLGRRLLRPSRPIQHHR